MPLRLDGCCKACGMPWRAHVATEHICECRAILYPCDSLLQEWEPDAWEELAGPGGICRHCGEPAVWHFRFDVVLGGIRVMGRSLAPVHEIRIMEPVERLDCGAVEPWGPAVERQNS